MTKKSGINEWVQVILFLMASIGAVAVFLFIILSLSGCVSLKTHKKKVQSAFNAGRTLEQAHCYGLWDEDYEQVLWEYNFQAVQRYLKK